jgi:hypothetical protein
MLIQCCIPLGAATGSRERMSLTLQLGSRATVAVALAATCILFLLLSRLSLFPPQMSAPQLAARNPIDLLARPRSWKAPHIDPPGGSWPDVKALVFFGRRRYIDVLNCYLRSNLVSNGGLLSEVCAFPSFQTPFLRGMLMGKINPVT